MSRGGVRGELFSLLAEFGWKKNQKYWQRKKWEGCAVGGGLEGSRAVHRRKTLVLIQRGGRTGGGRCSKGEGYGGLTLMKRKSRCYLSKKDEVQERLD